MILTALILTILVEFPVILFLAGKKPLTVFTYTVLINALTLPIATFVYEQYLPDLILIEGIVICAECLLIAWLFELPCPRSLGISFLANGLSALLGVLLPFIWQGFP
jgi:hypothetical protein